MMSTSPAYLVVTRFTNSGTPTVRTDHYLNLEDMLAKLLMNSGEQIPFLVRDKLLPPAIATWERQIKQDNCDHTFKPPGICTKCDLRLDEPSEADIDEDCR